MNPSPFVVIAFLFILFAWSRAILRYKDKNISFFELMLWSLVWTSAVVVIVWPGLTGDIAIRLGIGRGVDVVIYASIIVLFYLVFRVYIKISNMNRELTRLVRELALNSIQDHKKS